MIGGGADGHQRRDVEMAVICQVRRCLADQTLEDEDSNLE